jgi:hypothetical protein
VSNLTKVAHSSSSSPYTWYTDFDATELTSEDRPDRTDWLSFCAFWLLLLLFTDSFLYVGALIVFSSAFLWSKSVLEATLLLLF